MTVWKLVGCAAFTIAAIATGGGCGEGPKTAPLTTTGESAAAIQGGTTDTGHSFAVGLCLQAQQGTPPQQCGAYCSGALIAPNLVMTARHCVQEVPNPNGVDCTKDHFSGSQGDIWITTDSNLDGYQSGGSSVRARWHHVGSAPIVPTATAVCGNDIALLVLDGNVSANEATPVTPAVEHRIWNTQYYSTDIAAVGFGATDPNGNGVGTRRIKQRIPVYCVPGDPYYATGCDTLIPQNVIAENEFLAGDGTCGGDSGSSAYEQTSFNKGAPISFGVLSRGGSDKGNCVQAIYTRADKWAALIIQAGKQAAQTGGYSPPAWTSVTPDTDPVDAGTAGGSGGGGGSAGSPSSTASDAGARSSQKGALGDTCKTKSDCTNNTCVSRNSKDYVCSATCKQDGDCSKGFSCTSGYCFETSTSDAGDSGSSTTTTSGCAVAANDPTRPIPWRHGALVAFGLGLALSRSRRRR